MPPAMIRARRDDDLDACVELLGVTHKHDGYPIIWLDDPRRWIAAVPNLAGWVAERDNFVVGHAVLRAVENYTDTTPVDIWEAGTGLPAGRLGAVSRLYSSPDERGLGTGQRLLRAATAEARRLHRVPVLDVLRRNRAAIRLYQREGWTEVGGFELTLYDGSRHPTAAFALIDPD